MMIKNFRLLLNNRNLGFLFIALIILVYCFNFEFLNLIKKFNYVKKANVNLIDLNQSLLPSDVYDEIICVKSAKYLVETTLCIHEPRDDIWVSNGIWSNRIFEPYILKLFLNFLKTNPNCLVIDIGANIVFALGLYTMFAAKMGLEVVAIEPFYDNILRIHKAARIEKVQSQIKVIKNALSNQRNQLKRLRMPREEINNIGAQRLSIDEDIKEKALNDKERKYFVETILLDDILEYLPVKKNCSLNLFHDKLKYHKAIMKIDVEGFEPYVFQNASLLFENIEFIAVFMEWTVSASDGKIEESLVQHMIQFFLKHKLEPFSLDQKDLINVSWRDWPTNMVWMNANYSY